ncbi:MAG TPA: CHASE2 domain-containing protein, partial [Terriglobales bacterium]|nr:CHASE2 domain-containing protein [Terriglobales bacterium]
MDYVLAAFVTLLGLVVYAYIETSGRNAAGLRFIENIEARSLDARFSLRGERAHDDKIVIVGLEETTLQKVGAYPIPRSAYAALIRRLTQDGARTIVFDFNFPVPEKNSAIDALKKLEAELGERPNPGLLNKIRELEASSDNDRVFADAVKSAGSVVLGHIFLDEERAKSVDTSASEEYFQVLSRHAFRQVSPVGRNVDPLAAWKKASAEAHDYHYAAQLNAAGVYANLRVIADGAASFGFFNEIPDPDGTFRRSPLIIRYKHRDFDDLYPSLDFEAARHYAGISDDRVVVYLAENGVDHIEVGERAIRPEHDGTAMINYAGHYKTYQHYPMIDVINGSFAPGTFRNKLVVFGPTALGVGDLRATPFHDADYMGVEIHANVMDNLLHFSERGRGFLSRGYREEAIDLFFILLFGVGLGFWFSHTRPLVSSLSALTGLFLFGWIVYFAFAHYGMWLGLVIPAGTLAVNYGTITSFRMIFEEREKRKVRRRFERYVSPGVISLLEKDPRKYFKTGGESKELTVMFSDIRSFTSIAEGLTPDELVRLL